MAQKVSGSLDPADKLIEGSGKPCLCYLKTITLAPTQGFVTTVQPGNAFNNYLNPRHWGCGYFNSKWRNDIRNESEDTVETLVDLHEITCRGSFQTLSGSLGDPHKLCLTSGQIDEFFRQELLDISSKPYPRERYDQFVFLFPRGTELLVNHVYLSEGDDLDFHIHRLDGVLDTYLNPKMVVKRPPS